jgi:hypothetical protein
MWDPQHLTALWASTACYRDTFTYWKYNGYKCVKFSSLSVSQLLVKYKFEFTRTERPVIENQTLYDGK